jgi:asparagine synthase (glutamine-hydrolysing)
MRDAVAHRGPDGARETEIRGPAHGPEIDGWIGHRRLKVIDLTERSDQPLRSDDGVIVLAYNGEVYNFRELRRELQAQGMTFRSSGDTEVVLRAYEAWGDDFVRRLDGMFAIAVWNTRTATLLLARDRTGKKPLFYTLAGGRLVFGSEIKSLLASPWVERKPDLSRIPEFLTYGYVPHPGTLYEGILQVPPACTVAYRAGRSDGPAAVEPPQSYWDPLPEDGPVLRSTAQACARVGELLAEATERRMISDVPLGALLSGGIDSSLVVGLMTQASTEPVHTFSIGFPDAPSFDERSYAREVAEHFGTRHKDFAVQVDAVGLMDRLLWHHDQPYADSSAIPTYLVSRLAREHVTVVLNGDGGDEVFGGYDRFVAAAISRKVPSALARGVRHGLGALPVQHGYYSVRRRAERFLERADAPVKDRYQSWISVLNEDLLAGVLGPGLRDSLEASEVTASMRRHYDRAAHLPELDQILYANFKTYLPDDLAVKMDRMSMANSLETRSPFLDTALVEYLARMPARDKVGLRRLKPVLRKALFPLLPRSIWDRKKHGFGVPMGPWFRGELGTMFEDEALAADARSRAFLEPSAVASLWNEHRGGERENGFRLWTLLTLERWLRSLELPLSMSPPAGGAIVDASAFSGS